MDAVIPDASKTLAEGAIAPWNTPGYAHEREELERIGKAKVVPLDVPYRELSDEHKQILLEGSPKHKFQGLSGFFEQLERRKYKMHVRVFLSRWRSYHTCPTCGGTRLRPEALAVRIGGKNLAEISALKIEDARQFLIALELTPYQRQVGRLMLEQAIGRLGYLERSWLRHISLLDRTLRTPAAAARPSAWP